MRVTDHYVGDVFGFDPCLAHGFVGAQVVLDGPEFEPAVAVESGVEEDIVAAASDQPESVDGVDLLVFGSAHNHVGD